MRLFFKRIVIVAICGIAGLWIVLSQFYGNAVRTECVIELSSKLLSEQGASAMVDSIVMPSIRHRAALRFYANQVNLNGTIKAGRYKLKRGMDVIDIVRMLQLRAQTPLNVIFNNARGAEQLAGRIGAQIEADSVDILAAITSEELAKELGLKSEEMLAIFIPNTYNLWWTISPEDLVRKMSAEYEKFWTPARDEARKRLNLSRVEVSTLASIVYEESAKVDEMPRIAGVYINRLRKGYRLQSDPTVKFAIGDFTIKRVLYKHLEYDSPYNTYKHRGLPPGPIAIPSIAALESVLNYEKHNYLYFCARPEFDGYHNFTATYSQHLVNAKRYAEELNRQGVR